MGEDLNYFFDSYNSIYTYQIKTINVGRLDQGMSLCWDSSSSHGVGSRNEIDDDDDDDDVCQA